MNDSIIYYRNQLLAFVCHCWAIFMPIIMKRIAPKLRRFILLHFGLMTLRFHYWKTMNPHHLYDFGIFQRVLSSPNHTICLWRPQDTTRKQEVQTYFKQILCLLKYKLWNIETFESFENDRHRTIMKSRFENS